MKRWKNYMRYWVVLVLAMTMMIGITGCGGFASMAPGNLTFDTSTGSFTFGTVKGADTYLIGVSKVLNGTTGKVLTDINGAVLTAIGESNEVYLWSEQSGSSTGLADNDSDGIVDGVVIFREYSSSATTVGAVMNMSDLPLGYYVVQAMAAANDEILNPEPSYLEFIKGGTLAAPEGFTAQINDVGHIEVTAPSDYYLSCLTATGMPTSMLIEVSDGSSIVDTITMDDFSYTNEVLGPNKSYNFNNGIVTGTAALDSNKTYTVMVTAVGDGETIKDATANAFIATSTEATELAITYDTFAEGSAGVYDVSVVIGLDGSGNSIYELVGSVNGIAVIRESGTYNTDAVIEIINDLTTYPEGEQLTFATTASDATTPVLDGVTLEVVLGEQSGGGMPPVTLTVYNLVGEGLMLDGTSFNL